jgi:RNA polymerase sigma factor (sigma-70 family)
MKPQELARFETLLAEALPAAQRIALMLASDGNSADDILAEAVMRALLGFGALRDERRFQPWLLKITTNCYRMQLRRRKRRQVVPLDDAAQAADAGAGANPGHGEWLREAMSALPSPEKEAVVLHYLEGYPVSDAAQIAGVSAGAFNMRLSRARKRIAGRVHWRPIDG